MEAGHRRPVGRGVDRPLPHHRVGRLQRDFCHGLLVPVSLGHNTGAETACARMSARRVRRDLHQRPRAPRVDIATVPSTDQPVGRLDVRRTYILPLVAGALGFCVLVTLNSGGYHYGVSDQAFYIPVVLDEMDPRLFPHDGALIAAQDRFLLFDDWFAPLVRTSGMSLPAAFLTSQVVTLLVLYGALIGLGVAVYRSWWTVGALLALVTVRHRIPDTGANSVEGYFHPRMLAFALGLSATALYLAGRSRLALGIVVVAILVHPTIGFWFAIMVGGAAVLSGGVAPKTLLGWSVPAILAGVVTLGGPLREQLVVMDPAWLRLLVEYKDYLVVPGWPLSAWLSNLGIAALVFGLYRYRQSLGVASRREGALIGGCALLLGVFLVSAVFSYGSVALAVQLQVNRVFWLMDYVGVLLLAWLLVEGPWRAGGVDSGRWVAPRRALVVVIVLLAVCRGGYRGFIERPERPVLQVGFENSDWNHLMVWAATQPVGTHFLADPVHAARYGTSVRAASGRDVYLELIKDSALAIYSPDIASRVAERVEAIGHFNELTAERAGVLARQYALDYLITEQHLDLPVANQAGPLLVYVLGP